MLGMLSGLAATPRLGNGLVLVLQVHIVARIPSTTATSTHVSDSSKLLLPVLPPLERMKHRSLYSLVLPHVAVVGVQYPLQPCALKMMNLR